MGELERQRLPVRDPISPDLQAFLREWDARVQRGHVSASDGLEYRTLRIYDCWLQRRRLDERVVAEPQRDA